MKRTGFALLVTLVLMSLGLVSADDDASRFWSSWRGPLHTGVAPHASPPVEWSETKNVSWKVALPGKGHATPVVWGDRIYVLSAVKTDKSVQPVEPVPPAATEDSRLLPARSGRESPIARVSLQEPPKPPAAPPNGRRRRRAPRPKPIFVYQFVVSALDRHSGTTVWQTVVREEVPHEPGHLTASQASASPVTDGEVLIAHFGSRGLFALDLAGKVLWEQSLGQMTTRNEFGEGSSPVLHGETVLINWDHEGDSFIAAFDRKTGAERWKVARDEPTSWSTPLIVEDGGRALAVVAATNHVRAYDLATGKDVWQCAGLGLNCVPAPVAADGIVWVMSGYREPAGLAIRYPGARGDLTGTEAVAWRLDVGLSYVPSPLLYDGKLYFLERFQGMLSCMELASGKVHYTKQRIEGLANVYASPVGADGRIYIQGRDGEGIVLRHGEKFELLAQNKLDDVFDASPVLVGDTLYLRGHEYLYALRQAQGKP